MVDRYLARELADLQDRLVELGVDEEEAERFVDDLEKKIKELLASSESDTSDQDEGN
jgi:polyhydroxyalkanoate synthesis regulator phasin